LRPQVVGEWSSSDPGVTDTSQRRLIPVFAGFPHFAQHGPEC
jgi:hypothetical protein